MECMICGSSKVSRKPGGYHYRESGLKNVILYGITVQRCHECGETTVSVPRLAQLHRTLALHIITQENRLSPDQIVFLRKILEWNGADLARHMHVAPATVSRWEQGKREMSEPIDLLLRLAVAHHLRAEEFSIDSMAKSATTHVSRKRFKAYNKNNQWETEEAA